MMEPRFTGIAQVPRSHKAEAVAVLSCAFENDPSIRFYLENAPAYAAGVAEFFDFLCEVQFVMGPPPLGCYREDQLVGVALFSEPFPEPWPASIVKLWESFGASAGSEATRRLERYGQLMERLRPDDPHFYLFVVGVDPYFQGQGYGRKLLDEVHRISERHSTSTGVALDTENPRNVPLYEHLGYHVLTKAKLEELDLWLMFRPNG
jgi:ribosomal protein S18 acetylase RimI-like enzyme